MSDLANLGGAFGYGGARLPLTKEQIDALLSDFAIMTQRVLW